MTLFLINVDSYYSVCQCKYSIIDAGKQMGNRLNYNSTNDDGTNICGDSFSTFI